MLTIRFKGKQRTALARIARILGKRIPAFARGNLEQALAARSLATRTTHVKGTLSLNTPSQDSWAARLKERNWRS